ncbi:MAG: hypothetical protein WBW03_02215 [Silvibacterium sp.]
MTLRHNSQPYSGINILMLWASAMERMCCDAASYVTGQSISVDGGYVMR